MKKRLRGLDYIRGFSLVLAIFLLFMLLVKLGDFSAVYKPPLPLQKRNSEALSNSLRFAFLADIHKGWGVFEPIMKEIVRSRYSFVVIGGDFVAQNRDNRYRFLFRKLVSIKRKPPIYFVPGNHDVFNDDVEYSVENFHRYCGPDDYWFSRGDVAFVVLNDARTKITKDQFHWLETTLRELRGTATYIFVIMHIPPFDPRPEQNYCLTKKDGKRFMMLMEKYGVAYVFSGHIHCYFKEITNGVTYIVAPPAGGTPRCTPPSYGYIHVTVTEEGIQDSVVTVENKWWLQLQGDIQYELRVKNPFLLPLCTVVLGQSFFYSLAL